MLFLPTEVIRVVVEFRDGIEKIMRSNSFSPHCLLTHSWNENNYINKTIPVWLRKGQNNFCLTQYFPEVREVDPGVGNSVRAGQTWSGNSWLIKALTDVSVIVSNPCPLLCKSVQHLQADGSQPCLTPRQMPPDSADAMSWLVAT